MPEEKSDAVSLNAERSRREQEENHDGWRAYLAQCDADSARAEHQRRKANTPTTASELDARRIRRYGTGERPRIAGKTAGEVVSFRPKTTK